MADKTVTSESFSLQLDTGQKNNGIPVTEKVSRMSVRAEYSVNDNNGIVSDVNSKIYKEITKEQFDKLGSDVRDQDSSKYYAILATRNGKTGKYTPNNSAIDEALDTTSASSLFKRDIGNINNGKKGQFLTVNAVTQKAISKEEGLSPADVRNKTNLSSQVDPVKEASKALDAAFSSKNLKAARSKNEYGGKSNLKYPLNISDTQDVIQFTQLEYSGLKNEGQTVSDLFSLSKQRVLKPIQTSVTLPIQSKITDQNLVEWGSGQINPVQAIGIGLLNNPSGAFNTLKEAALNSKNTGQNNSFLTDVAQAGKVLAFQEALGIKNLLSRTQGAIFNPNTELLFRGPMLRPFTFSFFLAARSKDEAKEIRTIIRYFKQGMAVKETNNNLFLKAPNVFKIKYVYGKTGGVHPGLNQIKECGLKSFNVDYNPDNSYMTFEDGTMTAYRITMQFQELLPVVDTDYFENNQYSTGPLADPDKVDFSPAIPDDHIGF